MTMITEAETSRRFVPGMGVDWLLPLYDPCTWLLRLDRARHQLLRQAELRPGLHVLDIGCGTGSLAVLAKRLCPAVEVVGTDPDEKALSRAARKARRAGVSIQFARGWPEAAGHGSRLHALHGHRRPADNEQGTVLGLLTDAGLANATKTADRTVLRFIRMVYYRAGGSPA